MTELMAPHSVGREGQELFFRPYLSKLAYGGPCGICQRELNAHNWAIFAKDDGEVDECSYMYSEYYLIDNEWNKTVNRNMLFNMFLQYMQTNVPIFGVWEFSINGYNPREILANLVPSKSYVVLPARYDIWRPCN